MGRPLRVTLGGYVYHVLNRGNGRMRLFLKDGDYEAFERILAAALEHVPGMRLLGYCLLPNHWHLLLWPRADGELSDFGHWLGLTHTQRWHAHHHNVGCGHFVSGPVQVVSGGRRRALLWCEPVRGTQRIARGSGEACRGLALGQLVAARAWRGGAAAAAAGWRLRAACELGGGSQSGAGGGGVDGIAAEREPGPAVRGGSVGGEDGQAAGSGKHASQAGAAAEGGVEGRGKV